MRTVRLGRNGPVVSRFGLGCYGMAGGYGPADDKESIATIQAALDAGITMLDVADVYGRGKVELLLRDAIKGRREKAFIAVRFGANQGPDGQWLNVNASPDAVRTFLGFTLTRLGTDYVDLYQPARIDPKVPVEETVGAIADMVKAGFVRHIGLSEASAQTVRRAYAVHPLASLQIEYSLFSRGVEREILPTLRELGMSLVAYGVLSRGLLSSSARSSQKVGSIRAHAPRFADDNFARNVALSDALGAVAKAKGLTTAQLALAWVASRGDDVVPLIGARRRDQLDEAIAAADLTLSSDDLKDIERAIPASAAAGARYAPPLMAQLDSEKA